MHVTKNGQEIVFEIILQNGALCKIVRRHSNKACPMDEKDAAIVADMISEYNCYLRYGHSAKSILLGYFRPDEELMDWRKLPIGW